MRSWRYYRNLSLFYITLILMIVAAARALVQPVFWILTAFLLMLHNAVRYAFHFAHPWRRFNLLQQDEPDFKEVRFKSRDGLTLFGRFIAARNHATLILVHGLGASSVDLIALGRLFVRVGYGVLLLDLRGH